MSEEPFQFISTLKAITNNDTPLAKKIAEHMHKPNNKEYFKYILDKPVYDLIEYCAVWPPMRIEFFTNNRRYKDIWKDLSQQDKWGICSLHEQEYDDIYNCYCVEISAPSLLHFSRNMHKSFRRSHLTWFEENAKGKGYTDLEEIHWDWARYKLGYVL